MPRQKIKILFLCTHNSCRSQMAEGWANHLIAGLVEPYSAGLDPHPVDPFTVMVMKEAGLDISSQYSKHVDELHDIAFDYVITVCDNAYKHLPSFSEHTKHIHFGLEDPSELALKTRSEENRLKCYRNARFETRTLVMVLPRALIN